MKNKTMKRWSTCLLVLCTVLTLCACGGKTPVRNPETVMKTATEKLNAARSASFDMEMQMAMGVQGQKMDLGITMSADTIVKPFQVHSNMHMDMFNMDTEVYMVQAEDGSLTTYTGIKQGDKVTEWYKTTVSADDPEGIQAQIGSYDAGEGFSTQLEIAYDLKEIGAETVNGKKATRYDGVIHGSDIGKAMGQTGAADTLEMLGIDPSKLDKDVPISIWIYEDGMPAKYDIDMTDMMAELFAQNEETAAVEVSAMRLTMTITGVDTVSEIVVPQEALDAQEISAEPEVD